MSDEDATSIFARMSATSQACRQGSSQGCHEDAARKTVPWNLSLMPLFDHTLL